MERTYSQRMAAKRRRNEAIYQAWLGSETKKAMRGQTLMRKYGIETRQRLHSIIKRQRELARKKMAAEEKKS
jgi:hypothetical protein